MKKRRLSVRIDGVWYRVSHGKLHKINREATIHGGRSELQPNAKAYKTNSSPRVSDEALVHETMTALSIGSAQKQLSYKKAKRNPPILSSRQSMYVALPEGTSLQSSWKQRGMLSGGSSQDHGMSSTIDGLCSFDGGKPQRETSQEFEDSGQISDSGESIMSTATSARKPLVIRIKLTKVTGQL